MGQAEETGGTPLKRALAPAVLRKSLMVALVVGSLLTLINQYEAFFGAAALDWLKVTLTFVVPFAVATYGAYSAFRAGV